MSRVEWGPIEKPSSEMAISRKRTAAAFDRADRGFLLSMFGPWVGEDLIAGTNKLGNRIH